MQHMFRTAEVEVHMGLIWLLWQKKWKSHLLVKKSKKIFFLVQKGCFWCKMMWWIQKSWSQCSTMLTFWEIRSFPKNGWLRFVAKNNKTIFFRKVAISLKVSVVEHWDQLFWIPPLILHQKHPFRTKKKQFFRFLSQKWHSCHFSYNDCGIPM